MLLPFISYENLYLVLDDSLGFVAEYAFQSQSPWAVTQVKSIEPPAYGSLTDFHQFNISCARIGGAWGYKINKKQSFK